MGVTTSVQHGAVVHYETWVHSQPYAALPPYAVVGGHDVDGSPIYVGRAFHEGDQLPAKVIPSKGCAYVAYGGQEHTKSHYEILVGQGYAWVPCAGGSVPPNAVRSGTTRNGEPLYVGRGHHGNSLCVGKIHPSHGCLYIPFGGQEIRVNTYEVLVMQRHDNWVGSTPNYTPPGAVVAGHDTDRAPIYVARANHQNEMLPAKFIPSKGCAYVCYGGYEYNKQQFEVLCGYGYSWVKTHHHAIPPNAVSTGRSRNGEPLYVGRGHHHGSLTPGVISISQRCLYIPYGGREIRIDSYEVLCHTYKWVHSSAYSSIPPDAVIGGNDTDGSMMYVGRSYHNGDTLVAKILPAKHIAFITWRGEEIPKEHFEVLCGQNLVWRHCYDHMVPENAVLCGETSLGQPVYIGRGHYNGSLTIGKISSVHRALFIPYGGGEKRLEAYEILIHEKGPTPGWAIPMPLEEKKPIALLEDIKPLPLPPPPAYALYPPEPMTPLALPPPPIMEPPPPYAPQPIYQPQPEIKPSFATPCETLPPQKFSYTQGYVPPTPSPMPVFKPASVAPAVPAYVAPSTPAYVAPSVPAYVAPSVPSYSPAETYQPPVMGTYSYDRWEHTSDSYVPSNAFRAGYDTDQMPLYVCRAFHAGETLPGKFNPSHRCAYICHNGHEVSKYNFEVLVGERYHWVSAFGGDIPPGHAAVEAGRTAHGEVLYVGRGYYNGSLTPGKLHRSHGCLYIPYGGREIRLTDYEVLVRSDYYY